jgi:hypothetical protein
VVKSVSEQTVSGYGNSTRKEWVAVIEPMPEPVAEVVAIDTIPTKAVP